MRLAVPVAAVILGAIGCGSSSPSSAPTTATTAAEGATTVTTAPPTTAEASPTTSLPPTSVSTTAASPALCTVANLQATFSVIPNSQGAGNEVARIVLTNSGSTVCQTYGYVGMLLLGANGAALPTDVVRVPGTSNYPIINLAPGASASATARFSPDIPGTGDSQTGACQPTATSTEITPPDNTAHLIVPGPGTSVCEGGTMSVGPLQSGSLAGQ